MEGLRQFEKPMGFHDFPPPLAAKKRAVEERVGKQFRLWGYQEVITPTLEFHETVGGASAIPEERLFKLIDREGKTLVLRPDQTAPIARVVASSLCEEPLPLRLFYHANVFRAQENILGRDAELFQSGVELVGDSTPEADAEVIALAVEALRACELSSFRLVVSHVGLLNCLLREAVADEQVIQDLKLALRKRDIVRFRRLVREAKTPANYAHFLLSLLDQSEGFDLLERIDKEINSPDVRICVGYLKAIWEALKDYNVASYVVFDPVLTGSLAYYTGIYFEGYADSLGFPLLSGGRYDQLLKRFGRSSGATGFALKTDRLMEACPNFASEAERVLILYPQGERKQALSKGNELRNRDVEVVLHPSDNNEALAEEWIASFSRVIRMEKGERAT